MDISSYLLGKKAGGGGGQTPQTYLLKNMEEGDSVAGLTLQFDTTGYTSEQLIDGLESEMSVNLATLATESESNVHLLMAFDGTMLNAFAQMFGTSIYTPDGILFENVDTTHFYICYVYATGDAGDPDIHGIYVLSDLSANEIYGSTTFPSGYLVTELDTDSLPESEIWNCIKLKEAGTTPAGKINIDLNGTYNVGNFATAVADVSGGIDIYDYFNKQAKPSPAQGFNTRFLFKKIPEIIMDPLYVTSLNSAFAACVFLEEIEGITNESNSTDATYMFQDCKSLKSVPLFDTSKITIAKGMFQRCSTLTEVPQFNFSSVTNFQSAFQGCTNLATVPVFNFSKATDVYNMFSGCTSLSNDSLNNIMASCISATRITSNKTLAYMSLTSVQATTCTGLSNYNDFVAAGWTTGY